MNFAPIASLKAFIAHRQFMDQDFTLTSPDADEASYRVLARKYRPQRFEDLIGQTAMVKVLSAAFETGRVAHAYMLTGVRGVGKTTTARLLARAFNFVDSEGKSRPSIKLDPPSPNCETILAGNHMDVLEMDAASRTGIDDIREIIDSAQFKPAIAPYKVFIIDEVHMLSKAAFNGLLKILEEPPSHVKFIFATTEIRKVPVTILSRCQRFDLRRVDPATMVNHLSGICKTENVTVEKEALSLIARASEGSVRDALSLLDQSIAQGAASKTPVTEELVRDMLGLADRERVLDLLDCLFQGSTAAALKEVREQYELGADPLEILRDLLDLTNWLTRVKVVGKDAEEAGISQSQAKRGREMADKMNISALSNGWQILLKGVEECANAPRPHAALEMLLVRFAHAATLPSPEELVKRLRTADSAPVKSTNRTASNSSPPPPSSTRAERPAPPAPNETNEVRPANPMAAVSEAAISEAAIPEEQPQGTANFSSFADIADALRLDKDYLLLNEVETHVHFVSIDPPRLEIRLAPGAPKDLARRLNHKMNFLTGEEWTVAITSEQGQATLREKEIEEDNRLREHFSQHPVVAESLKLFPDAQIVRIRKLELRNVSQEDQETTAHPDLSD